LEKGGNSDLVRKKIIENKEDKIMIKLKNGELQGVSMGLHDLSAKELPVKAAYWVAKIARKIESELRDFEAARMRLISKYGDKDDKGFPLIEGNSFKLADTEAFNSEYAELADIDVEIDCNMLLLGSFGDITLKPQTMLQLMDKIICDDQNDSPKSGPADDAKLNQ
jgi:hypothetical protein